MSISVLTVTEILRRNGFIETTGCRVVKSPITGAVEVSCNDLSDDEHRSMIHEMMECLDDAGFMSRRFIKDGRVAILMIEPTALRSTLADSFVKPD